MVMLCFVLDLRSIPPLILRDLKLSLLQLANFYAICSPSSRGNESQSKPLPDRIGLCYFFKDRVTSDVELEVAYSPKGNFNLRDFHHAVNSLPSDAFCPEFSIAQPLSCKEMNVSDVLNEEVLYSWGSQEKDISKKLFLICCYVIQNLDQDTKNVLRDAADKCISVEYLFLENKVNHPGDVADSINSFIKQIGDLENCSFRSYLSDAHVFSVLAKQWFQELKDDIKGLIQCRFIFKTNLIDQVDQISCNLHPSLNPVTDGFTSCQTCRCHGILLNKSNENQNKISLDCPVTGLELGQSDVIDNSVHVGDTILFMPSFQCCQMLHQISSSIDFSVRERTNLDSLSEGFIFGASFVVAPSTYHELDDIEKAERNNQFFLALCHVLNSLEQGLVCCSNCNLETMKETSLHCYYVLLPSDKGMMLLRRLVASEELPVLDVGDVGDGIGSRVTKETEDLIRASLLKIEARDYNPHHHERGFHQKLNLLVKESLQFGVTPLKVREVGTELDITSPDSDVVQPVQGSSAGHAKERIPKLMGEVGGKNSNECLAKEWEQLIVTELPKIHSPTQLSQPHLESVVLSPTQSAKQLDEKTSRILERLEVPKELKRKTVSPTTLAVGISDPCLLRKKPLIPYGHGHDDDQAKTSQPIKPSFQRLKRKK